MRVTLGVFLEKTPSCPVLKEGKDLIQTADLGGREGEEEGTSGNSG